MLLMELVMGREGAWHDVFGDVYALWVRLFADKTQRRDYRMVGMVRKGGGEEDYARSKFPGRGSKR